MLYILSGSDDYSLSHALDGLKKEIDTSSAFSSGVTTLDGQQVTPEQLRNVCNTAPFLSGKRLVIIRGLLERFEPKGRPRQRKAVSPRKTDSSQLLANFKACFEHVPESTILALVENRLTTNNPLFNELSGKAVVKLFPLLKEVKLRQWIQQQVKKENGTISTQAVDLLAKLVGGNLWIMAGEINKLVLFASVRRIEDDDVRTLVGQTQQADVFDMVDAILEFKAETASQLLQQLLQKGAAPTYLLFMLCRQVRLIVRARELTRQGTPETEIQNRLGLSSGFIVRKTIEQSKCYSLERLQAVYQQLLAADLWIKTGKYDGELAIAILVAELCQRRQPQLT
ncbi:MAG: DNA polymerase III subunit delta [Dehalococcoidales bacterium]|nr:DNA polymerase III subunit delta [Dehalococcoidales bacterium]